MTRRPAELVVRIVLASVAAAALGLAFGRALVVTSLPLLDFVAAAVWPQFVGPIEITGGGGAAELRRAVASLRSIEVADPVNVPAMTRLDAARTPLAHALVPAVIALTTLVAWPLAGRGDLVRRIVLAGPLLVLVLALTLPFTLMGLVEIAIAELRAAHGNPAPRAWEISYLVFLEAGGRWLLPLALALACLLPSRRRAEGSQLGNVGRRSRACRGGDR